MAWFTITRVRTSQVLRVSKIGGHRTKSFFSPAVYTGATPALYFVRRRAFRVRPKRVDTPRWRVRTRLYCEIRSTRNGEGRPAQTAISISVLHTLLLRLRTTHRRLRWGIRPRGERDIITRAAFNFYNPPIFTHIFQSRTPRQKGETEISYRSVITPH